MCSSTDVLVALWLEGAKVKLPEPKDNAAPEGLSASEQQLYAALTYEPTSLDELGRLTALGFAELCGGLEQLAQAGLARDLGGWWERL